MTERTAKGTPLARGERLQVMLDAAELKALDDFRFSRRMPSRAATVRELLRRGLAAEGFLLAEAGARSGAFGVLGSGTADGAGAARGRPKR